MVAAKTTVSHSCTPPSPLVFIENGTRFAKESFLTKGGTSCYLKNSLKMGASGQNLASGQMRRHDFNYGVSVMKLDIV